MTELLDRQPPASGESDPTPPLLLPSWTPYVAAGTAIAAGMAAVLWTTAHVHADALLREVALFVHLGCLVVGFGAVIAVDWIALLWVLGRRSLTEVLGIAGGVHVLIWIGYAGLVLSGVLLSPDLASTLTQIKLALVLVIGLNGASSPPGCSDSSVTGTEAGWFSSQRRVHPSPKSPGGAPRSSVSSTPANSPPPVATTGAIANVDPTRPEPSRAEDLTTTTSVDALMGPGARAGHVARVVVVDFDSLDDALSALEVHSFQDTRTASEALGGTHFRFECHVILRPLPGITAS